MDLGLDRDSKGLKPPNSKLRYQHSHWHQSLHEVHHNGGIRPQTFQYQCLNFASSRHTGLAQQPIHEVLSATGPKETLTRIASEL